MEVHRHSGRRSSGNTDSKNVLPWQARLWVPACVCACERLPVCFCMRPPQCACLRAPVCTCLYAPPAFLADCAKQAGRRGPHAALKRLCCAVALARNEHHSFTTLPRVHTGKRVCSPVPPCPIVSAIKCATLFPAQGSPKDLVHVCGRACRHGQDVYNGMAGVRLAPGALQGVIRVPQDGW